MTNQQYEGPSNYFISESGAMMSIEAAVTAGYIYRGVEPGTVVISKRTMTADAAVGAGYIGQDAANYVAGLANTNVPAPFTREDPQMDVPEVDPADVAMASLAAFFGGLPPDSKAAALAAITAGMKPVGN